MNIRSKKGFGLAMAIYLVILSAITSIGLYTYAMHIYKEAGIQGPRSMRGYYAALAGARYAYILLKDPVANLGPTSLYVTSGGITTLPYDGETVTFTIGQGPGLGQDILLHGNDALTVTVTEYDSSSPANTPWTENCYQVTADFRA